MRKKAYSPALAGSFTEAKHGKVTVFRKRAESAAHALARVRARHQRKGDALAR